tara:strand:- start:189 stop:389 length:201 start_codon:yes stop_codon:yes gene_type:complete
MFKLIKKFFTPKKEKDEHIELFEDVNISDIQMFDEQYFDKTFENETKKESMPETKQETKTESTFGV